MLKAALIAAGRGERLRHGGIAVPKPLVPIAGVPLIERVLSSIHAAGITEVACILNAESETDAVESHCRRVLPQLDLRVVRRSTASSMESLFELAHMLREPFLLLTVDAIFGPRVLPQLLHAYADHPTADGVLAVHNFIDDEKPLHVRADARQRITAIGSAAADSALITAGLYVFHPRIFTEIAAARAAEYTALRQFLTHLCERGYALFAALVEKTIDVDRPEDIVAAEAFIEGGYASPFEKGGVRGICPTDQSQKIPLTPFSKGGTSRPARLLCIRREPLYSPGKVDDDRAILEATAAQLASEHHVAIISAADALPAKPDADVVLTMAQGPAALATMRRWQADGVRIINTPAAIAACHRQHMIAAFERAGVPQPSSVCIRTDAADGLPAWLTNGAWIKRSDVHATHADDVAYVETAAAAATALATLARRGIAHAIIQRHVRGPVFKFYAVRGTFFACFPSPSDGVEASATMVASMRALAEHAADALDLELYGGDCVQHAGGALLLIDLNDWPSYRPCRLDAAHAIARYVATTVILNEVSRAGRRG